MTAGSDRDRIIEQLLQRSRRQEADPPPTDACLDAETLAAWMDGGLDNDARMAAASHAAGCVHCQAMLGAFARATPAVPPALPWWRRQWGAWLVPLTAAATAVTLWMVVPGQRDAAPQPSAPVESVPIRELPPDGAAKTAPAPKPDQPAAAAPAPAAVQGERVASRAQAAPPSQPTMAEPSLAKDRMAQPADQDEFRRRDQLADAASAPKPDAKREEAQKARAKEADFAPQPVGAAARQGTTGAGGAVPPPPPPVAPSAAPLSPPPAAVAAPAAGPVDVANRAPARGFGVGRMNEQNIIRDVPSPDPAVRWRIAAGSLLVSRDGGGRWESVEVERAAEIVAGASPARDVCWLVGRRGLVLLTIDGRRFARLSFPETVDLAGVNATDARTASATTIDGRVFATTDAGASWRRTP